MLAVLRPSGIKINVILLEEKVGMFGTKQRWLLDGINYSSQTNSHGKKNDF